MCKELYNLASRYRNVDTTLNKVSDKKYKATSSGEYVSVHFNNDEKTDIKGIDFEGGPFLFVDSCISGAEELGKIKTITPVEGGYELDFE